MAHKASASYEVFEPIKAKAYVERLAFVFTPPHGSWLNRAEIELSVLQRDCLNRHIATEEELIREVKANWQSTNQDVRIKFNKLYPTT